MRVKIPEVGDRIPIREVQGAHPRLFDIHRLVDVHGPRDPGNDLALSRRPAELTSAPAGARRRDRRPRSGLGRSRPVRLRQKGADVSGVIESAERYRDWIEAVFEAPDLAEQMSLLQVENVRFASQLFRNLGAEIARYDNDRVSEGLEYIFYSHKSNIPAAITGTCCPLDERLACMRAAASMYRDCFETRCEPVLLHRREPYQEMIAVTCYMLWDASGLLHWKDGREAVLDVLKVGLGCANPACQESALHGLGHLSHYEPRVSAIIGEYLAQRAGTIRPELVSYAQLASRGHVQ